MNMFLMQMTNDWGGVFAVVFTGIAVVFAVLILLILSVWLLGKIMGFFTGRALKKTAKAAESVVLSQPQAVASSPADGELPAVISAAIYAYLESAAPGKSFRVCSIRPVGVREGRKTWAQAGIMENTAAF
ncbi:MAG: OadG family protein [Oscillospiraceae bacterium]|nr:OadG family protein [Oscillospiraceae bacterium]